MIPSHVDITTLMWERGTHAERVWMRFLWSLVHLNQPDTVVEIGTGPGASTRAIALAIHEIKRGLGGVDIDTWAEYPGHLFSVDFSPHVTSVFTRLEELGLSLYVTRIKKRSKKAALSFGKGSIDLLIIDGDHYYDEVMTDFTSWIDKISDGGYIVFHDMIIDEVKMAFDDIVINYPLRVTNHTLLGKGLWYYGLMRKHS